MPCRRGNSESANPSSFSVCDEVLDCDIVDVATGFTTHSGWAIAVTVGVVDGQMEVHDRRRVELVSPELPRQAYHAATELGADEAEQLVEAVDGSIATCAVAALDAICATIDRHSLVAAAIVGDARAIPDVTTVLGSHALMHAAEGEQYRRGLANSAARRAETIVRVGRDRIDADVAAVVGWSVSKLAQEQARVRSSIGPPWRKDHKDAAAAALIALHTRSPDHPAVT